VTGGSYLKIPGFDYELSDRAFRRISALAMIEMGISLEDTKMALVRSRLIRRLRALKCKDFDDYCDIIERPGSEERDHFITAITTNVTAFYREPHHFETLECEVLPKLVERARAGGRVRVWSAGCSSGQEAFSIAASALTIAPDIGRHDFRILGTDIDKSIIEEARVGRFNLKAQSALSDVYGSRLFDDASSSDAWEVPVRQDVRDLVTFEHLNLMAKWPMSGPFDVIFCRNVAIYFDRGTQARLWIRFASILAPGGYLFLGHSERVVEYEGLGLRSCGVTTYVKD